MTVRESDSGTASGQGQLATDEASANWQQYHQPIVGIVHGIAGATDTDPEDISELSALDGNAINKLLQSAAEGNRTECVLSFVHEGHRVTVWATGEVVVEPISSED